MTHVSRTKTLIFFAISFVIAVLLAEILLSALLLYRYRSDRWGNPLATEISHFSLVNVPYKIGNRLGFWRPETFRKKETSPAPFLSADQVLGFKQNPGTYKHTYYRKYFDQERWERMSVKVTITEDGTRWTGAIPDQRKATIYLFGDSFMFGTGVNDEQTMGYLLQQARPDVNVRVFAVPGYGLTQTYLNFERLAPRIEERDIIILGYADFYDARTVVAPSILKDGFDDFQRGERPRWIDPRAGLDSNGKIRISYPKEEDCSRNMDFCTADDPPVAVTSEVSAAIVNSIAERTKAKVYLLHFDGSPENPIRQKLDGRVTLISALEGDFGEVIRDDVLGFDKHPGPYWHHAMSGKLVDVIEEAMPKND